MCGVTGFVEMINGDTSTCIRKCRCRAGNDKTRETGSGGSAEVLKGIRRGGDQV